MQLVPEYTEFTYMSFASYFFLWNRSSVTPILIKIKLPIQYFVWISSIKWNQNTSCSSQIGTWRKARTSEHALQRTHKNCRFARSAHTDLVKISHVYLKSLEIFSFPKETKTQQFVTVQRHLCPEPRACSQTTVLRAKLCYISQQSPSSTHPDYERG
jgi:hypothetical protein